MVFPVSQPSAEARVSFYYFVQAMSVGAINAFAGIWLSSIGITPFQIGVIYAAPVLAVLVVGIWVGRVADRAEDWRQVIIAGAVASAVFPLGLYFSFNFWNILLFWTLAATAQMVILPVTDAASIRLGRRQGGDFGRLYAWKTAGYLLVIFLAGFALTQYGSDLFLPLFVILCAMRGLASLLLPPFRAPIETSRRNRTRTQLWQHLRPAFVLPLVAWSLVHCTHFVLNGFLGLLWNEQGLAERTIGFLIALSGVAEVAMFLGFKKLAPRFSLQALILVSCLAGVLRWGILGLSPGLGVLVVMQLFQALTYALGFLACTNFIADNTEEDIAAEAQSFFVVVQSGMAIAALIGFGWLADLVGIRAFFLSAALAGIGVLAVTIAMAHEPSRAANRDDL